VTRQKPGDYLGRLEIDGAGLRQRLADVVSSIAYTEDQVAKTMERMALVMPHDAARLRAHAARARRYAALERDRAAMLGVPASGRTVLPGSTRPNDPSIDLGRRLRSSEVSNQPFFQLEFGLPVGEVRGIVNECLASNRSTGPVQVAAINRIGRTITCTVTCSPLKGNGDGEGAVLLMEEVYHD